jgi:Flp pilus assembly protein TadB
VLSDREQRVLHDLELQFSAEDPDLARALRRRPQRPATSVRVRAVLALVCCWLVVCVMVAAGMTQTAMKLVATGALLAALWRLCHLNGPPTGPRG